MLLNVSNASNALNVSKQKGMGPGARGREE